MKPLVPGSDADIIYQYLLKNPGQIVPQIAEGTGLTLAAIRARIDNLYASGRITRGEKVAHIYSQTGRPAQAPRLYAVAADSPRPALADSTLGLELQAVWKPLPSGE